MSIDTAGVIVPIADGKAILRCEKREISILLAREEVRRSTRDAPEPVRDLRSSHTRVWHPSGYKR
jgi:hypothetical protein